ncbi:DUF6059 family protein [Kitasatospora sp. NPDC097643]|uniref:DUF6059 family protein n=1 Tax=Kitasatospora sp. NPDC097643 TaxID=3157230 RepID=UPI00332A0285
MVGSGWGFGPVGRALAVLGAMFGFVPPGEVTMGWGAEPAEPAESVERVERVEPGRGAVPPRGHPERLRPDVPLSDVELALQRECGWR